MDCIVDRELLKSSAVEAVENLSLDVIILWPEIFFCLNEFHELLSYFLSFSLFSFIFLPWSIRLKQQISESKPADCFPKLFY